MEINLLVAQYAKEAGVPVMLNSAPYAPLSPELLSCLTYISPNEHEAADLAGLSIEHSGKQICMEDVQSVAAALQGRGVPNVLITLGSAGAAMKDSFGFWHSPCIDSVAVQDPTAAGDSFVGAFCTAICHGLSHPQAMEFANYTAALTVSRMGAQPSLPTLAEVVELIRRSPDCTLDPEMFAEWEKE